MFRILVVFLIAPLVLFHGASSATARPLELFINTPADDGVERNNEEWDPDASPLVIGRPGAGGVHDLGLRFVATPLFGCGAVEYARLRFSARGGQVADSLSFAITGVLETESPALSAQRRPSQLPRTSAARTVVLQEPWRDGGTNQLFYYTGDLSPIINEIIAQPGWGGTPPALILCVDNLDVGGNDDDHVACSDLVPASWPVTLQVARHLRETLTGHELVGRPTDHSATINFAAMVALEVYVEYGPAVPTIRTTPVIVPADTPWDIELDGLAADTRYAYRLCYRRAGSTAPYEIGLVRSFRTQRPPGASFRFSLQADSHIWDSWANANPENHFVKLYQRTIDNLVHAAPDFHFSLGDYSLTEYSLTQRQALDRYLVQRRFLDDLLHSVPFYLVIGNHEGELGYVRAEGDSVPAWAEHARRACVPNPHPDGFYAGCPEPPLVGEGWRESYYAWEWGDALFVVLDPYWYTLERPFHNDVPGEGGGWVWTLGREQYDWLHVAVSTSERRWKFVLIHHLVGGVGGPNEAYGRGGIEAVKFRVAGNASYEWGGEGQFGFEIFATRRPGWEHGPIHDLLVEAGVTAVIKGHDHFYAWQELDGLIYLTVPQPQDAWYGYGGMNAGQYSHGTLLPNAGHVQVDVSPDQLIIDYVQSFLPGDGPHGLVIDRHVIGGEVTAAPSTPRALELLAAPNPSSGQTIVRLQAGADKTVLDATELQIYNVAGRLVAVVPAGRDGSFVWDQRDGLGRRVASGSYQGRVRHRGGEVAVRLAVIR